MSATASPTSPTPKALAPAAQAAAPDPAHTAPAPGQGKRLAWHPSWPKFRTAEWIATGAFAALTLSTLFIPPGDTPLRGGLGGEGGPDAAVRNALRITDYPRQRMVRDASDVLLTTLLAYPHIVDSLAVAAWYRDSQDVAWQMSLINMQTIAVTMGLHSLLKVAINRERPYAELCGSGEPGYEENISACSSNNRYHSFFSGHTSAAFASAGLICSHHSHLPLYGGGAADVLPCVGAFTLAAVTGTLRVASDQHYFTDVLTGAVLGTLTGLGLPWLLHYRFGPEPRKSKGKGDGNPGAVVGLSPWPNGAGVWGVF